MSQVGTFHCFVTATSEHSLHSQPLPPLGMSLSLPRPQGKVGPLKAYHS